MRAHKVDANQKEVVAAFRKLGYSVAITSSVGHGFTDLVVGKWGHSTLVEIKDGMRPPSERRLTPDQEDFHKAWLGSIIIVESVKDVIEFDRKRSRRRT